MLKKAIFVPLFLLSALFLSAQSSAVKLGTVTAKEIKATGDHLQLYSLKKPVTDKSSFVFAIANLAAYVKINGKLVALTHDGGGDTETSSTSWYVSDSYDVWLETKFNGDVIAQETLIIKNKKGKQLYKARVYQKEI